MNKNDKPMGFGGDGVKGSAKKMVIIFLITLMSGFLIIYKFFKSKIGGKEL